MEDKKPVFNYLYFGLFFLLISLVYGVQVFLVDDLSLKQQLYFSFTALAQGFIEAAVLMVVFSLTRGWVAKVAQNLLFALLLLHTVDFPLVRIMDMSVWYALDFVMAEDWPNFVEMLKASNVSMRSWIIAGFAVLFIPLIAMRLYRVTQKFSSKRPLPITLPKVGLTLSSVLLLMTIADYNYQPAQIDHEKVFKALPWKATVFSTPLPTLVLGQSLAPKPSEEESLSYLASLPLSPDKKPNIFLFIVESLREDFLTPALTPHLAAFREKCSRFTHALSAANATQFSWFSIFHSVHAFHFGEREPSRWKSGSLPLQLFKKIGYKIHLLSSARLEYYRMIDRIFGQDHHLLDSCDIFDDGSKAPVYEKDQACMQTVLNQLDEEEGHLYLVFLDSTHFDYSWPQASSLVEAPGAIDYFGVACKNGIDGVKQRYCNAVHFIDSLLGTFFEKLSATPHGEEAVVVITGDHGEEFLEQGNIFHASSLSSMQTRVPIYCRLGVSKPCDQNLASHVDIFPTLVHHVTGQDVFGRFFDGESLLNPRARPFVVASRYNASRSPFEFLIYDGEEQLVGRFENQRNIFNSPTIHLVSLRDQYNMPLELHPSLIHRQFKPAFDLLFQHSNR